MSDGIDRHAENWRRYVAMHSPATFEGTGNLYAFAQAYKISRDEIVTAAITAEGDISNTIGIILREIHGGKQG